MVIVQDIARDADGRYLLGGRVHGLVQVTYVGGGDAGNRGVPVLGQVDAVVPGAGRHLLGRHPSGGKHPNLVSDVQSRLEPNQKI